MKTGLSWLVTGSAGFIGKHLVKYLRGNGEKVVEVDNFSNHTYYVLPEYDLVDVRDAYVLTSICNQEKVDIIVHLAALGSVPRSIEEPRRVLENNVNGLLGVLLAAREAGVGRVVYASSSSVHGIGGKVQSPYAASKVCNEVYAQAFSAAYGMSVVGLRYFNVYGEGQPFNGPYSAVIPRWIRQLRGGLPTTIYGDGLQERDFTYVKDVVHATVRAALSPQARGVYEIGSGAATTLLHLHETLVAVMGLTGKRPPPLMSKAREGDIRYSRARPSRAWVELGYASEYPLQVGLMRTVAGTP